MLTRRSWLALSVLLLGAPLAHVDLRHGVVVDLGEVDGRGVLPADLAEHVATPQADSISRPDSSVSTRSASDASLSLWVTITNV